jgi:hypothetical protein
MTRKEVGANVVRLARALAQIEQYLKSMDWPEEYGAGWSNESWFASVDDETERGIAEARGSAREILRALARGARLPGTVDRAQLVEACKSIRQDDDFDVPAVRGIVDHAALILTDPERGADSGSSGQARKPLAHFPTPDGAKWRDVEMKVSDGHTLTIKIGSVRRRCDVTEMGMADRRNGRPDKQWELLHAWSLLPDGILEWSDRGANVNNKHRKKRLAEALRNYFRIDGDPFELTHDRKGWKARFRILPER